MIELAFLFVPPRCDGAIAGDGSVVGVTLRATMTLALLLAGTTSRAEDRLRLIDRSGQVIERTGEVIEYDSKQLQLRLPSGTISRIPAARVVTVQAQWTEAHQAAERLFRARDYGPAVAAFRAAYRQEKRPWVQRLMAARSVECWYHTGDIGRSAKTFLALLAEDEQTRHRSSIPLAWRPQQPDAAFAAQAERWLADRQASSPARLIAASWLLSGRRAGQAESVLDRLMRDQIIWIADLARVQRWRLRAATADQADVNAWQQFFERLPPDLRAGPAFVLAQAWQRHRRADEAALAYLQVAWWDPPRHDLAADALWSAGQLLQQSGRDPEAQRIWRELVDVYPESPLVFQARASLEALQRLP